MRLAISLVTRGRPDRFVETISRSIVNWTDPNTILYVMADEDDPGTAAAFNEAQKLWNSDRVKLNVGPRELTIAGKWNRILKLDPDCPVYLNAADDDPYVTPGYDSKILEAAKRFPDGIGIVYGHMANASFTRVSALTNKLCKKLGYMYPEYFPYWFVDHWNDDIVRQIGRISFADVTTDQSRPGKTMEMREPAWWANWFDAAYLMRRKIAHDLIRDKDFKSPPWLKEMLLAHYPIYEWHSKWTNETVRAQSPALEQWSGLSTGDERYQQVKQAAVAMVPHLLNDYGMDPVEALRYRNLLTPPQTIVNIPKVFA